MDINKKSIIITQIIRDIINGKINLKQTKIKIQDYEKKYGEDFFENYNVETKDKPWNQEYLHELELKSMSGMSSKPFILHLAEVSEYVYAQANKKKRITIAVAAGVVIAIAAGIVIAILALNEN